MNTTLQSISEAIRMAEGQEHPTEMLMATYALRAFLQSPEGRGVKEALEFYSHDMPTIDDPKAKGWVKCKLGDMNLIAKAALALLGELEKECERWLI